MKVFPVSWSILLLLLFFASSVRAEEYSDSGNWGPDAPIEPEAAETPKEAVKEKEEEERKEEPKAEAKEEKPPEKTPEPAQEKTSSPPKDTRPVKKNPGVSQLVEKESANPLPSYQEHRNTMPKKGESKAGDKKEAEAVVPPKKDDSSLERVEWFSLRGHVGSHGYGAMTSLFTLCWNNFFWSILKGGADAWGPGWMDNSGNVLFLGGTHIGYLHKLDPRDTSQLRFGAGMMGGFRASMAINKNTGDEEGTIWSVGPFVDFEMSYILRPWKHVAFEAGIEVIIPLYGWIDSESAGVSEVGSQIFSPMLMNFIGMRF